MAGFYAARSGTIPPLPWSNFAPPLSAAASEGAGLRRFPHWIHILLSLITSGLWLPGYLLMYLFRNKRYYY